MTTAFLLEQEASDPRTIPARLGQLAHQSAELAFLVVRNPNTTAAMLRRFAQSEDQRMLDAILEHPSTPERVSHQLADRFPDAFAKSLAGRVFLSDPTHRPPRSNLLRARLGWRDAPAEWFERASRHETPSVRVAAATLAPSIDEARQEQFRSDPWPQVRTALAQRAGLPAALVARLALDASPSVRAAIAAREELSDELRFTLARDPDEQVRAAAARQPATPTSALLALASDSSWAVLWSLVENPSTPGAALEQLAATMPDATYFAWSIIHHPNATETVSATLLAHPSAEYRHNLILAARVFSLETWKNLCADPSPKIRHSLAFRSDIPDEIFPLLAGDKNSLVRSGIARHPRLPVSWLERLVRDPDAHTRSCAVENPSISEGLRETLTKDPSDHVRLAVAKYTRNPALLRVLSQDSEPRVRLATFYNHYTPPEIKAVLERDSSVQFYRDF